MKKLVLYTVYFLLPIVSIGQDILVKTDSTKITSKIGNYIKFNIHAGVVVNNTYSNLSWYDSGTKYRDDDNSRYTYNCNINVGFNVLFGKNKYIKPIININYLRSRGDFEIKDSYGNNPTYQTDLNYTSKIDFINFTTGLRFVLFRHLCIEPLASFNLIAKADVRYTGTKQHTETYVAGYPLYYATREVVEFYNNEKTSGPDDKPMGNTFSFCPRISYEFNIKQQPVGVYVSYNFSSRYYLPWCMAGIIYYPFKKLR